MSATLQGIVRDTLGSRPARKLRLQGRVPANIQGEGKDSVNLSIDEVAFLTARRNHEHLFDIEMDKGETETALVRELQWNAFGDAIVHVEFKRVIRGQKTEVEVELEFTGHPKGGVLNHLLTHVTVMALPSQIPDSIEVKVDGLDEGHPVHAKDLILPDGVDLQLDPETTVAVVTAARAIEEEPAEGEADELEGVEGAEEAAAEEPTEG